MIITHSRIKHQRSNNLRITVILAQNGVHSVVWLVNNALIQTFQGFISFILLNIFLLQVLHKSSLTNILQKSRIILLCKVGFRQNFHGLPIITHIFGKINFEFLAYKLNKIFKRCLSINIPDLNIEIARSEWQLVLSNELQKIIFKINEVIEIYFGCL